MYASQRVSFDKDKSGPSVPVDYDHPQHAQRMTKKGRVLKTLKDMAKHLIPDPKGFDDEK